MKTGDRIIIVGLLVQIIFFWLLHRHHYSL
jgi:hypothetical protein